MQNFFGGFCGGGGGVFKKFGVAGWVLTITRQEKNSKTPAPKQKWGRVGNRKPASYLPCIHSYLVSDSSDSTTKTSVVHVVLSIVATWHMVSPHQRPSSFIQPKKKKKNVVHIVKFQRLSCHTSRLVVITTVVHKVDVNSSIKDYIVLVKANQPTLLQYYYYFTFQKKSTLIG